MTDVLCAVTYFQEEGLKLTFSKQSNGSAGETSGRQGHKEKEVHDCGTCWNHQYMMMYLYGDSISIF